VLVLVSDHGTGSTNMGNALDAHPCVFDVGEGFGASEMLWTTAKIDECGDVKPPPAIFDTDSDSGSHKLISRENPKMEKKIDSVLTKKDNIGSGNLAEANHAKGVNYKSLYDDLEYDISEYLLRIRDLICENVPSDVCPEKQCTISTKMFPQFIDGITAMQLNKADLEPNPCHVAQNKQAMVAWKDALRSFKENPRIATVTLERDEKGRQFSIFHRFAETGKEFDCSFPRPESEFAIVSKDYTDHQMKAEDCWKDPDKCLNDALKLVSLSPEAMGNAGSKAIADELERRDDQDKLASKSCSTDPQAIFRRLKNEDVQKTSNGDSNGPHVEADEHIIIDRDVLGDVLLGDDEVVVDWSLKQALHDAIRAGAW
jgi:hypothetical protein